MVDTDGRCKPKTPENRLENQRRYNAKMRLCPDYNKKQNGLVVRWIKQEYATNCDFREKRKKYYRDYYHKKKGLEQRVMDKEICPTGKWTVEF